jgi:hypothetical protein
MIHVDWATAPATGHESAAALVASLRAAGFMAGLMPGSLPPGLSHSQAGLLAHLIAPAPPGPGDRLLILSAHAATDEHLAGLRSLAGRGLAAPVLAGRFETRQAEIGIAAKYSYVLGESPVLLPLPPEDSGLLCSATGPVIGADRGRSPDPDGRVRVLLIAPDVEAGGPRALQTLAAARRLKVTVLTDGESKTALRTAGVQLPVYHYGEAPLSALAARCDVAVFGRAVPKSYPMRLMLADLVLSGVALLDAAPGFANRARDPAFLPAPADPAALAGFLAHDLRDGLADLALLARGSAMAKAAGAALDGLRAALSLPETRPMPRPAAQRAARITAGDRVLFLPTNGVGLGHAQRCALIAGALAHEGGPRPAFAAFPSCLRLIKSHGFDAMPLVQKTGLHAEGFANDLVNSQRLEHILPDCAALVFDGGYVFTSVFRALLDHRLPGVWVRRGLWQAGQDNALALDREKVFQRVIVPAEAFDELNADYSAGPQLTHVGPIVQETALSAPDRARLREALAKRFGHPFRQLVVTMLGGGVAADRSAQSAALAAALARRPEVLHLIVVWPTAVVDPGLFGWPNTRVVRTHHAGVLSAACDLAISAVGYNSFHEALYARVPTIFVPQMAAFMDDQRARARAAADRGVARLVEAHELATLDRTVTRMLDRGEAETLRAALDRLDLPAPGTQAAAACIAEVAEVAPPRAAAWPSRRTA